VVGGVRTTISTAELRLSQSRIEVEEENRKGVQAKREVAADSLQSIQLKILDLDTNLKGASELGPLQYLSGLTGYGMDRIINWLILIIIFVFDPLAVALVVAFNNALKVDKGEKDKKKVVEKRELYGEKVDDGNYDAKMEITTSEEIPPKETEVEEPELDNSKTNNKILKEHFSKIISKEQEKRKQYENEGWKNSYEGRPYFKHPWFDWNKKERWINDRNAIKYWMTNKGGSEGQLDKIKEQYPTDFNSKTY
jgi:hypothetical protein